MDILKGLNPAQEEAVKHIEGPLLIVAGPGSGKTGVITHRIAYLVKVCGINTHRIMAVTFTNKAANEMKERLNKLLGASAKNLTVGTFHAICARILRSDGKQIGIEPGFVIYDDEDQEDLLKKCLEDLNIDPKRYPPKGIQSAISAAKSHLFSPADMAAYTHSYYEEIVKRVYERYQQLLTENNALDFDDLIMRVSLLFKEKEEILTKYQSRYLHILVDEFQDTNQAQYQLVKQLAARHGNICVVGDPDQSIYSWRFADITNILNFEKDFSQAKVILLEQNYRSTRTILKGAQDVISKNVQRKDKKLWTTNEEGECINVIETSSEQEEALFVVNEIEQFITKKSAKPGDFAVMYRTNAQSRVLEEAFVRYGIPYKLIGGTRFYHRREVKDIIAYLRLISNPYDSISLLRIVNVPARGIGAKTLQDLSRWCKLKNIPLYTAIQLLADKENENDMRTELVNILASRAVQSLGKFQQLMSELAAAGEKLNLIDLLDLILKRLDFQGYLTAAGDGDDRWENVLELRTAAGPYKELDPGESLRAFLETITLMSDTDELDEKANRVTLITLHQAKGLEFPVVFITGMEEGLFPHRRSFDDPSQMEEERRLCYVGMTRAQKHLYLLQSTYRSIFGSGGTTDPSRFLDNIPSDLVRRTSIFEQESKEAVTTLAAVAQAKSSTDLPVLKCGDHVNHSVFGEGIIINCKPVKDDQQVIVVFKGAAGVKKLLLSMAPMKVVN